MVLCLLPRKDLNTVRKRRKDKKKIKNKQKMKKFFTVSILYLEKLITLSTENKKTEQ